MRGELLAMALIGAAAGACGGQPATSAPARAATQAPVVIGADRATGARDAEDRIRPEATAGLYWQAYVTCDECAPPAAVVAYVAPDVATARLIVDSIGGQLGVGRPFVLHTDALATVDEVRREQEAADRGEGPAAGSVAVITGAFSTRDAALVAATGSDPIQGLVARVIEIDPDYGGGGPRHVTVIDRGAPTPAWSADDVAQVEEALGELEGPGAPQTLAEQDAWILGALRERRPACTVRPGDLFVVEDGELDWYRFAPVRCGGRRAYVEWTRTLLGHAVVVDDDRGGHRLFQVVGAECDAPIIQEWRYDEEGRHPPGPTDDDRGSTQLALGRC